MVRKLKGKVLRLGNEADNLLSNGHFGEAAGVFSEALRLNPKVPQLWYGMGKALEFSDEIEGALKSYQKALELLPDYSDAYFSWMGLLMRLRQFGFIISQLNDAPESIQKSLEFSIVGCCSYLESGDYKWIQSRYEKFPEHFIENTQLGNYLIRASVYDPEKSGADLLKLAKQWSEWNTLNLEKFVYKGAANPNKVLKVGFVMTRLRYHNMGVQLHALLKELFDSECRMEISLFLSNDFSDELTNEAKTLVHSVYDITRFNDLNAIRFIRNKEIDILIEMNEFTNDGRLALFTARAAPVQIHYLGNAQSTGVPNMDYRISTSIIEMNPSVESSEKVLLMENGYHFYVPPSNVVELITKSPAIKNGYITFGCIHHLAKYNEPFLNVIKKISQEIPDCRFILARQNFEEKLTRDLFMSKLEKFQIPLERVELRGDGGKISSLEVWRDLDCVLDSFPFGGDATTLDALYAGVPVISLLGQRISARRASAALYCLGLSELVSVTKEEYVEKAVLLSKDIDRLQSYRRVLHERFKQSSYCQHKEGAKEFHQALREAWAAYCEN